jgi:hypothetical protein
MATTTNVSELYLAVYHRREAEVLRLLAEGVRVGRDTAPDLKEHPLFFTSSVLMLAMYRGMSVEVVEGLLKAGAPANGVCEFTFQDMLSFVLYKCVTGGTERQLAYMQRLIAAGAYIPEHVADELIDAYLWGSTRYSRDQLRSMIGDMVWQFNKWDKCAARIQRAWRAYRQAKAARRIQACLRSYIYHPEHIWSDGQTTVARLFTKYGTV